MLFGSFFEFHYFKLVYFFFARIFSFIETRKVISTLFISISGSNIKYYSGSKHHCPSDVLVRNINAH